MTTSKIADELANIVESADFYGASADLTDAWSAADLGIECVEPILRFMEQHPDLEYGVPGPLVHFVERFLQQGYAQRLLESVARRPTPMTAWMLNRLLNATDEPAKRLVLVRAMRRTASSPDTDQQTLERIQTYLNRLKAWSELG